jgi:hypothetical protein
MMSLKLDYDVNDDKIIVCELCNITKSEFNKSDSEYDFEYDFEYELKTNKWTKIKNKNICPNCVSLIFNSQFNNENFRKLIRKLIQEELSK